MAFAGVGLTLAGRLPGEINLAAQNGLYLVLLLLGGMVIPFAKLPGRDPCHRPRPAVGCARRRPARRAERCGNATDAVVDRAVHLGGGRTPAWQHVCSAGTSTSSSGIEYDPGECCQRTARASRRRRRRVADGRRRSWRAPHTITGTPHARRAAGRRQQAGTDDGQRGRDRRMPGREPAPTLGHSVEMTTSSR